MSNPTVEFEHVQCIKETDAALLCVIDGEKVWMPLSQIDDSSEVLREGDEGMLVVTKWIAKQKGLV